MQQDRCAGVLVFVFCRGGVCDRCTRQSYSIPTTFCCLVSHRFVPGAAGASKLRLCADSSEDGHRSAVFTAPGTNGGGEDAVPPSVCLPQAVAPDIVPVILAFLYTDRLVQEPDFGHDGFAEEYLDPAGKGDLSMPMAAVETERYRPRGSRRSGFDGVSGEAGSMSGADWDRENGAPSKVRTSYRQ